MANNVQSISVVLSVYNEESKLERTLKSLSWADSIIVIDNQSTDTTAAIAKKYGATVHTKPNDPMLNKNKNFGFTTVTTDWILNLDADEEVTPELAKEIVEVINSESNVVGYWIPRKNIIFGKWIRHGLWWPDKQLRLFQKGKGAFACNHIHEYITVEGDVSELKEAYIHHNYESVSQYIQKLDTLYTENEVQNKQKEGYKVVWYDAIRFPLSDFLKVYFAQKGYLDGLHGLVLSLLQACYSLVVFAKLWEREQFVEKIIPLQSIQQELTRAQKELEYWKTTVEISSEKNLIKKSLLKVKRKYVTAH